MTKAYVVTYGLENDPSDSGLFVTLDEAEQAVKKYMPLCRFCHIHEYELINDCYVLRVTHFRGKQ